jgi:hypothetical protein
MGKHRIRNTVLVIFLSLVVLVGILIALISPITKYLIEKYDERYTGRQIRINWALVNPLSGTIHLDGLRIMECESDSVFLFADGLSLDFAILKAFSGTYEISKLTLSRPHGIAIQTGRQFNFGDLLVQFANKDPDKDTTHSDPVKFNLLKIRIEEGEFHFRETSIPIHYYLKNVNLECTGFRWDSDETFIKFNFVPGIGTGHVNGMANLNFQTLDYRGTFVVEKFSLNILEQYLKQISSYGTLRATLDANIKSAGNFGNPEKTDVSGKLSLTDVHFGKSPENDYFSFEKFEEKIIRISPSRKIFFFDSVRLIKPYFKFERYDSLDNLQNMFGRNGQKVKNVDKNEAQFNLIIELARYIQRIGENFLKSDYRIDRLEIREGDFMYNDYALNEKFSFGLHPFSLTASGITTGKNRARIHVQSGVHPYGNLDVQFQFNPKKVRDFQLDYGFKRLPITVFNPYSLAYTSFPFTRGTVELSGRWEVKNKNIHSQNRLILLDPRIGDRVRDKGNKWIPLPLVMALVRERGNVIDYDIPINGNLDNPKFNVWDPIWDVLGNLFIKPATLLYGVHVRNVERRIEKNMNLSWQTGSHTPDKQADKILKGISAFLGENPEAVLTVVPTPNEEKEREALLIFEAKKRFFLHRRKGKSQRLSEEDSVLVDKIATKDPKLDAYLSARTTDSLLFTIQHKSMNVVGKPAIDEKYRRLNRLRRSAFLSYFTQFQKEKQIHFKKESGSIPFNGTSLYEIHYSGDLPEKLRKAYNSYQGLNDDLIRKGFKKKRRFRDIFF